MDFQVIGVKTTTRLLRNMTKLKPDISGKKPFIFRTMSLCRRQCISLSIPLSLSISVCLISFVRFLLIIISRCRAPCIYSSLFFPLYRCPFLEVSPSLSLSLCILFSQLNLSIVSDFRSWYVDHGVAYAIIYRHGYREMTSGSASARPPEFSNRDPFGYQRKQAGTHLSTPPTPQTQLKKYMVKYRF